MKRSFIILVLVFAVMVTGVIGYSIIEGWSLFDAFYMTVITLTTTGYQEVHSLTPEGRIFTILLLMFGMGLVAYSISAIMSEVMAIDFSKRRRVKMDSQINKLKGHTIVCGFGRMGKVTCAELKENDHEFVVIEKDQKHVEALKNSSYLWIEGDATHDDVMQAAGIEHAKVLVSLIDNDSDSLYLALAARTMNPDIFIIARASEESAESKIYRAGANKVFLPIINSGLKVAESVLNPAVEDLLNLTGGNKEKGSRLRLADIEVRTGSKLLGKTLANCGFKRDSLIVVGIQKLSDEFVFGPAADYQFEKGDKLITLGTKDSYEEILDEYL